ncbi:MAG TPA: AtpZ/AtpI family protein [Capsulimonadaceae bacterium]|nr:AtpZ/AtpI family protein [Capsulimonadaceae bacterium]
MCYTNRRLSEELVGTAMRPDENDEDANASEPVEPEIEIPRAPSIPPPPEMHFERPTLGRGTPGRAFSKPKIDEATGRSATVSESGDSGDQPSHLGPSLVIGITLPACVVVGAAIGMWIDSKWPGVKPWGTVVMLFAGIAAGVMNAARAIKMMDRPKKK